MSTESRSLLLTAELLRGQAWHMHTLSAAEKHSGKDSELEKSRSTSPRQSVAELAISAIKARSATTGRTVWQGVTTFLNLHRTNGST